MVASTSNLVETVTARCASRDTHSLSVSYVSLWFFSFKIATSNVSDYIGCSLDFVQSDVLHVSAKFGASVN